MTPYTLTLLTAVLLIGTYLAFGPKIAGYVLLGWAAIQISGHLLSGGRPA